jgi:hypothetical protein
MATQKPSGLLDFRRSFPSVSTALPFVLLLAAMSFGCTTRSAMDRPVITGADGSSRTEQYRWRNVKVGGGGYVTGLVIHPKVPDQIYLRTDVGGIYKWDVSRNAWTALTDSFSREDWHLYGVESLALHPNDPADSVRRAREVPPQTVVATALRTVQIGRWRQILASTRTPRRDGWQ